MKKNVLKKKLVLDKINISKLDYNNLIEIHGGTGRPDQSWNILIPTCGHSEPNNNAC